ncbi:MAG: alpha-E domain-containing protein [Nitrospirota bacterium]
MLSRLANSLYWMSRYMERVGNTARLLNINLLNMLEDEETHGAAVRWHPLLAITGADELFHAEDEKRAVTAESAIRFMSQGRSNPSAIRSSLRLARENARVVRDRISREMWETINDFWLRIDNYLDRPLAINKALDLFVFVGHEVARFHGVAAGTMMRGEPFSFYLLGTLLERSDMTARILDVKYHTLLPDLSMVGTPLDYYQWKVLLETLSALEAYRRLYHSGLQPIDIAEFVIGEETFPRSLRFASDRMCDALQTIGCRPGDCQVRDAIMAVQEMLLGFSAHEVVLKVGLHEFLEQYLERIAALHDAIAHDYFEAFLGVEICDT